MILMDLIKFSEDNADQIVWGSGDQYGTMTFKCKSIDHGFIPLFYITTHGRIKISLNLVTFLLEVIHETPSPIKAGIFGITLMI